MDHAKVPQLDIPAEMISEAFTSITKELYDYDISECDISKGTPGSLFRSNNHISWEEGVYLRNTVPPFVDNLAYAYHLIRQAQTGSTKEGLHGQSLENACHGDP
jgi:hypothetical protein